MNKKQLLVIAGCLLIGVLIFLAPQTSPILKEVAAVKNTESIDKAFESQVSSVKKEITPSALATIEFFESKLKASVGAAKVVWLDSLSNNWDKQMRPGIAAEYVFLFYFVLLFFFHLLERLFFSHKKWAAKRADMHRCGWRRP